MEKSKLKKAIAIKNNIDNLNRTIKEARAIYKTPNYIPSTCLDIEIKGRRITLENKIVDEFLIKIISMCEDKITKYNKKLKNL